MKKLLFVLTLLLIAATASVAFAASSSVSASNPRQILEIAKGFGSAEEGIDNVGDPKITGRIDGHRYTMLFYGCENNRNCTSIQFSIGWALSPADQPDIETINEWNMRNRFGKAYIDDEGDPMLKIDLPLVDVPAAYLERWFSWWQIGVRDFRKHIDLD